MIVAFFMFVLFTRLGGTEYHVAKSGNDNNTGKAHSPFLSIRQAALVAGPGDLITVHAGIYRERVNPARGGNSDSERIIYQAAEGETVILKGSEVIKGWEHLGFDTWKVTLANSYFNGFNPYNDIIQGEWCNTPEDGYDRHTGAVYLNGVWLTESNALDTVLRPAGDKLYWFAIVDEQNTTIWAQFMGCNPNNELVEINVRRSIFYPDGPGRNFITVRGFIMRQAATPWSGVMSEQVGLVGTHWSKGWIIEDNVISHSMNAGITLGRYDLGMYGISKPEATATGYIESLNLAIEHGWSKDKIGSHIVRNNHISHCEKNGIHGSLGSIFSTIEGNTICDIAIEGWTNGPERAGIKLLGSQDVLIKGNLIVNCMKGIWLDWMAQGARVTGNLCFRNLYQDFYAEVNHGPYLVDNNLFLSLCSVWDMSQGGAYVHNLMAGRLNMSPHHRKTPFHEPHSTAIAGYHELLGGDNRFINNIFISGWKGNREQSNPELKTRLLYGKEEFGLSTYNNPALPVQAKGNVYLNGASIYEIDTNSLELAYNPDIRIEESDEGVFISLQVDTALIRIKNQVVTSEILGKSFISGEGYLNPDNSSISINKDFLGNIRDPGNPTPGPFELKRSGTRNFKVW